MANLGDIASSLLGGLTNPISGGGNSCAPSDHDHQQKCDHDHQQKCDDSSKGKDHDHGNQHSNNDCGPQQSCSPPDHHEHDQHSSNCAPQPCDQDHASYCAPQPCEQDHGSYAWNDGHNSYCDTGSQDCGDLHAHLASMTDTGSMLDAAICHMDSACPPVDTGCFDVGHCGDSYIGHGIA